MTIDRIIDGLTLLLDRLANRQDTMTPPDGWTPHEWAYVNGLASAQIMFFRDRLAR